jgi:hypothetical protein
MWQTIQSAPGVSVSIRAGSLSGCASCGLEPVQLPQDQHVAVFEFHEAKEQGRAVADAC